MDNRRQRELEADWERSLPPLALSVDQVTQALKGWRQEIAVSELTRLEGGHRNTNILVRLRDGMQVVLRFCASAEICKREANILLLLRGKVHVPDVLHAQPSGIDGEPPFLILEFVVGERSDRVLMNGQWSGREVENLGRALGAQLARVHEVSFAASGPLNADLVVGAPFADWSTFILSSLDNGRAAGILGPSLTSGLRRLVEQAHGEMTFLHNSPCCVHGDFKPPNILVYCDHDQWIVGGILDWEFAFSGPALFDVGSALRYEDQLPKGFAKGFEQGYLSAGGELPPGWRRLACLLDLLNLCDLANRERITPVMHRAIRTLITKSISALQS